MATQQNLSLVRRLFDEVYAKENYKALDDLIAQNIQIHDAAAPHFHGGLQALKQQEMMYTKAFPNKKVKIDDIMSTADDRVIVRWTCTGNETHKGEFPGIPNTNKSYKFSGIGIYRITNGKISEIWQNWDRLGLLEQIGEIQPALAAH
jgi:steroid delta-isomerase-like uncharacterized protein